MNNAHVLAPLPQLSEKVTFSLVNMSQFCLVNF